MREVREKYCMQLTVQEELGGKMHFLVAKGIKLQSWKDSGFECEVKDGNIPKISILLFCNFTYLVSFCLCFLRLTIRVTTCLIYAK